MPATFAAFTPPSNAAKASLPCKSRKRFARAA
jgi:hypothetical protein